MFIGTGLVDLSDWCFALQGNEDQDLAQDIKACMNHWCSEISNAPAGQQEAPDFDAFCTAFESREWCFSMYLTFSCPRPMQEPPPGLDLSGHQQQMLQQLLQENSDAELGVHLAQREIAVEMLWRFVLMQSQNASASQGMLLGSVGLAPWANFRCCIS